MIITPAELAEHQADAESLMQDTFTAASFTTEKQSGLDTRVPHDQGATQGKIAGRSRQSGDTATRTLNIGGVDHEIIEGGLHIPISAPVPEIGWHYTLTTLGLMTDPALQGSVWQVVNVPAKSYATARRLDVVRIS